MRGFKDIQNTVNWKYAEKELKQLPIQRKVEIYAKAFRPQWGDRELDIHDKLDILFKIPNIFQELDEYLTHRQLEVLKMMSYGCSHQEICDEFGYANQSSVSAVINSVRDKIKKMIEEEIEEDLEDLLIKEIECLQSNSQKKK